MWIDRLLINLIDTRHLVTWQWCQPRKGVLSETPNPYNGPQLGNHKGGAGVEGLSGWESQRRKGSFFGRQYTIGRCLDRCQRQWCMFTTAIRYIDVVVVSCAKRMMGRIENGSIACHQPASNKPDYRLPMLNLPPCWPSFHSFSKSMQPSSNVHNRKHGRKLGEEIIGQDCCERKEWKKNRGMWSTSLSGCAGRGTSCSTST